ncbi:MAG: hypothetical protein K8I29_05645 [Alphaproteobacteria bacterium]|uniref:O-antigen ligase family protein n=1 Tax=Candidatus Nitrobium versatile TaxID=2884831 RepID=A0A953J9Q6_9BACT|nr:hypothetical protein [Candidatus Nitrobium versatile]
MNLFLIIFGLAIVLLFSYFNSGNFDYSFMGRMTLIIMTVYTLTSLFFQRIKKFDDLIEVNNIFLVIMILLIINNLGENIVEDIYIDQLKSTVGFIIIFIPLRLCIFNRMSLFELLLLFFCIYLTIVTGSRSSLVGFVVFVLLYAYKLNIKIFSIMVSAFILSMTISHSFFSEHFIVSQEGSNSVRMFMLSIPFSYGDGIGDYLFGMGFLKWKGILINNVGNIFWLTDEFAEGANPHNFIVELFIRGGGVLVIFLGYLLFRILFRNRISPFLIAGLIPVFLGTTTGYERYVLAVLIAYAIIAKRIDALESRLMSL